MSWGEEQQKEIETIRERKIKRKALLYVSFSLDFLERGTFTEYP